MKTFEITNTWFEGNRKLWDTLFTEISPRTILEVGSYEGASTCYLIDKLSQVTSIEIHCVDTWLGGIEHQVDGMFPVDMRLVEARFNSNTYLATKQAKNRVDLNIHKSRSLDALAALIVAGRAEYFDFIYLDGSHQAPDLLADAVLSFQLLKNGGHLIFDDYLWFETTLQHLDILRSPKIAIDAFVNIYRQKLRIVDITRNQLIIQKTTS